MSVDWIPTEFMQLGARRMLRWIHPGADQQFTEPFFSQSVDALAAANAVQKLTSIDVLLDVAPVNPPRGLIFHVSRCGSTLVSRSLGAVARHRVISEATPVNQLLLDDTLEPLMKARLLKGLILALCGSDAQAPCFIKFSSWNLLFIEQIRALFPETPWVFVYREPAEVWQSLTQRPPRWAATKPLGRALGGGDSDAGPDIIVALERFFEAPLAHRDALALAVNYTELPAAMPAICAHFGLALSADEHAQIARMGDFDAKQTGQVAFRARPPAALPEAVASALTPVNRLYQRWEDIRAAGPAGARELHRVAVPLPAPSTPPPAAPLPSEAHVPEPSPAPAPAHIPAHAREAARTHASQTARDERLIELATTGQIGKPNNELLANAYRRRGDLAGAAAEYQRLLGLGNHAPAVVQMDAVLRHQPPPPRMPDTEFAPAPFVLMTDVLGADASRAALDYAVAMQAVFHPTELQKADRYGKQRACLVTYDVGAPGQAIRDLVRAQLPLLCARLRMPLFVIGFIQLKIAAYTQGDFFKAHQDNGLDHTDRRISFVYYFNETPQRYSGGELLLYDSRFAPRAHVRTLFTAIVPQNDSMIFFPSEYFHEVLPIVTATAAFRDCRFTLAGHIG